MFLFCFVGSWVVLRRVTGWKNYTYFVSIVPLYVDRMCGIWGSYYHIPKAIFYLFKRDSPFFSVSKLVALEPSSGVVLALTASPDVYDLFYGFRVWEFRSFSG